MRVYIQVKKIAWATLITVDMSHCVEKANTRVNPQPNFSSLTPQPRHTPPDPFPHISHGR
jgi:hypothetical protein